MKNTIKIIIVVSSFSLLAGCASALLATSFDKSGENGDGKPAVNKQALHTIQFLRALQVPSKQSHTFIYETNKDQLPPIDRYKLIQLINRRNHSVIVNIGPAKASTLWQQLFLTNKRAEVLKQIVIDKAKSVNIIFVPELPNDTINIVIGV